MQIAQRSKIKMNYFYATDLEENFNRLYQTEKPVVKDDYIVVEDFNGTPIIAQIDEMVSYTHALTQQREPQDIIDTVDFGAWKLKRRKEVEKTVLMRKMQDKVSEITLIEKLQKHAGKDTEMADMLKEYLGQSTEETEPTDIEE